MKNVFIVLCTFLAMISTFAQIQCKGTALVKPNTYTIKMDGGNSVFSMNGKSVLLENGGVQQGAIPDGKSYIKFSSLNYKRGAEIVEVNDIRFDNIVLINLATKKNDYVLILNFDRDPNFVDTVTCITK